MSILNSLTEKQQDQLRYFAYTGDCPDSILTLVEQHPIILQVLEEGLRAGYADGEDPYNYTWAEWTAAFGDWP